MGYGLVMNEAVLDAPSVEPHGRTERARLPHAFTSETARLSSLKAVQARRDRIAKAKADSERLSVMLPRTEQLAAQLEEIEGLMRGEKDADTLQKLSAAHSRVFSAWQVLSGTPNPGSAKSRVKRSAGHSVEPLTMSDSQIAPVAPIMSNAETVTVKLTDLQAMIDAAVAKALANNAVK